MINTLKLKAVFVENGLTQRDVALKLGLSHQSISAKINNKREFKNNEIFRLCELFNLNSETQQQIFFAKLVGKPLQYV